MAASIRQPFELKKINVRRFVNAEECHLSPISSRVMGERNDEDYLCRRCATRFWRPAVRPILTAVIRIPFIGLSDPSPLDAGATVPIALPTFVAR